MRKPIEKAKPKNRPKFLKKNETVIVRWELVDNLIKKGLNGKQIAAKYGIAYSTLQRKYADEFNGLFSDYIRKFPEKMVAEWSEKKKNEKSTFDEIEMMAQAGCVGTEIAAFYGVDKDFFYRVCEVYYRQNFTDIRKEQKTKGNALLKQKQFSLAMKGDRQMLTVLGKHRLEQSENINMNHNVEARVLTPEEIQQHLKNLEDKY